ncbi:MAG: DUF86 domain-containing protein [Planctomycetes bacterium]|nr:DUF86 domain-containing protein [Planctomycetota bacterium]
MADRRTQLAVERALEILGEAARRVSPATCSRAPAIPWRAIIAQRNVLEHEYGAIDQRRIFELVRNAIPPLREQLHSLSPPPPQR